MKYVYDESTLELTVLDDDGSEILKRRALKDSENDFWIDVPDSDQELVRGMIRNNQLFSRLGGAHEQMAVFSQNHPLLQKLKDGQPKENDRKPVGLLTREVIIHRGRLKSGELDETQTRNVKERIEELESICNHESDYKMYVSEYSYNLAMSRTIAQNMERAIDAGDTSSASRYWSIHRGMLKKAQEDL